MSNGELPEGFFGWVLGGVLVVITTLSGAVATLFKISENKNAKAIEEQEKELVLVRGEMQAVREAAKATEAARIECERDRASLAMECRYIKDRLERLEKNT